ncbi:MAG: gluconate 2-dehydrogenase subunit 3 family protein [Halobacteriota archaeon]
MELTRRDALAALAAGGIFVGGAGVLGGMEAPRADVRSTGLDTDSRPAADDELDPTVRLRTLVAAASILYPSEATGIESFVRTYVMGRLDGRETYRAGLDAVVSELNEIASEWYGFTFADLSTAERDALLRDLGVATADPDPDGPISNRIRHFVVDELLYAFYASPAGGRLVGIENPIGFPGGIASYRRGGADEPGEADDPIEAVESKATTNDPSDSDGSVKENGRRG